MRARLAVLAAVAAGACRTVAPPPPAAPPPPDWVRRIPDDPKWLYAVGISGPTPFLSHTVDNAVERARGQLALTVESDIVAGTLSIERSGGATTRDTVVAVAAVSETTRALVENAEVVATWVDAAGSCSPDPGTAYALVRMERRAPRGR